MQNELYEQFLTEKIHKAHVDIEGSLELLRSMRVITELQDVNHIRDIMELRRKGKNQQPTRVLHECRFIYYLWAVIAQDEISPHEFYRIMRLLIDTEEDQLRQQLLQFHNEQQNVDELINSWRCLSDMLPNGLWLNGVSMICSNEPSQHDNQGAYNNENDMNALNRIPQHAKQSHKPSNYSSALQPVFSHTSSRQSANEILRKKCQQINNRTRQTLSWEMEAQLVKRLYKKPDYTRRQALKKQQEQHRLERQLQECTFHPQTRPRSARPANKSCIKGFTQVIDRVKKTYQQNLQLRRRLQLRVTEPNEYKNKLVRTKAKAPRFHSRTKEENVLFEIEFDLGRRQMKVKVKEGDVPEEVADNICRIFSLKEDSRNRILLILSQEIARHQE